MSTKKNKPTKQEVKTNVSSDLIHVQHELEEINPTVFKGIPVEQKEEIVKTIVSFKHHSGPLPDPETLTQYNQIITDGANRIMLMAEKQQNHRIELEKQAVTSQLSQSKKGQIFGFIITLLIVGCGTYLAVNGHEKTGIVLIGTTLVALAGIFVLGKFKKEKST
ncbi:DUF2335 domain-containing protein [Flavobacterium commune]|uniref:DUF2335 domain-containing protein n=1 Tax=Flavobacterium commune TaxID=1306519 RepID=A0A1D9PBW0_9FLAO|nr:DUF2335 domain-containing protein [Flavobacterium commune]AOZ99605.1 hypothetical protein BIW12_09215 [Flavobacterium commune]